MTTHDDQEPRRDTVHAVRTRAREAAVRAETAANPETWPARARPAPEHPYPYPPAYQAAALAANASLAQDLAETLDVLAVKATELAKRLHQLAESAEAVATWETAEPGDTIGKPAGHA